MKPKKNDPLSSRTERLGAYQLAQQLLRTHADAVLIFDEVEDVFTDSTNTLAMLLGEAPSAEEFLRRLVLECRHKAGREVAA